MPWLYVCLPLSWSSQIFHFSRQSLFQQEKQFLPPWWRFCCSVTKSCPALRDAMDGSTLGFPVLHCLSPGLCPFMFRLMSIELMSPSISSSVFPLFLLLSIFPSIRVFSDESVLRVVKGDQRVGASALASVLPVNMQGWFPLGLTGLISLLSMDSEESSPAPQFESISFLYRPTHICTWLLGKPHLWLHGSFCFSKWTSVGGRALGQWVKLSLNSPASETFLTWVPWQHSLETRAACGEGR